MLQNRGNKPTFVNAIIKECLDITLATCKISELIHSWKVTDNETFSDHRLINFNLKGHFPLRKPFRNPRKTNWVKFRSILVQKLLNVEYQDRYLSADSLEKANEEIRNPYTGKISGMMILTRKGKNLGKPGI